MAGQLACLRLTGHVADLKLRNPVSITRREQLVYAMRFVACLLTMEAVLHFMYVVAIKDTSAWEDDSPAELSMIGFWNLVVVWLKVRSAGLPHCISCELNHSCSSHGATSASGHCSTVWIHLKT